MPDDDGPPHVLLPRAAEPVVRAEAVPALGRLTAVRAAIPRLVRLGVRVGVEGGRRGLGAVARVGGAGCEAGAGVVLGRGAGVAPDAVGDDAVGGGDDEEGEEKHHQQEDDDVGLKQICFYFVVKIGVLRMKLLLV